MSMIEALPGHIATASRPALEIAAQLAARRRSIDRDFLDVGDRLTNSIAILDRLTRQFEALPTMLESAEVEGATADLDAVVAELKRIVAEFSGGHEGLQTLAEAIASARRPVDELWRTIRTVAIVGVNARISAAAITVNSDDVHVFVADIARLASRANTTVADFVRVYRETVEELDEALLQRAEFERGHARTLQRTAVELGEAIAALGRQRAIARENSREAGQASREIAGRIGSAVMALQIGDATRQRLEHVEDALGRQMQHADPTLATAIAALQCAQVDDTAAALRAEIATASDSLDSLAGETATMVRRAAATYGGSSSAGALAELTRRIHDALRILRGFEREREVVEAVARKVSKGVQLLLSHIAAVQEIEVDMRLVSLNATVKCAGLGVQGAALTVIATQLRDLMRETVVAAEATTGHLTDAAERVALFEAETDAQSAHGIGELDRLASDALGSLRRVDIELSAILSSLETEAPKVLDDMRCAIASLVRQHTLIAALHQCSTRLRGLAPGPVLQAALLDDEQRTLLDEIAEEYSMQAERDVHATVLGMTLPVHVVEDTVFMDFEL